MHMAMKSIVPAPRLMHGLTSTLLACAVLTGCAPRDVPGNNTAIDAGTTALTPGARPVTVGEGGAGLNACIARGRVVNLAPNGQPYLVVRAAPFTEAMEIARLSKGAELFVCTRSIDQRWRGVVIPPLDNPGADCGVMTPVATVQPYDGPCRSGWIPSAFLELGAG